MRKQNKNEPIRVLHMIGSLEIGGSQSMVLNLYKAINRDKVQFDFIIDRENAVSLAPQFEALGANIYVMPQFNGKNVLQIVKEWNSFFNVHKEYKVLHSHVRSYASIYLPIAEKHGLKTIIHSHSTSNGKGFTSIVKKLLQYPLRYQADYFFACSKEAGIWLFGEKVVQKENFRVIYNGIDCDRFRFCYEDRIKIRSALGIEENYVIGHVGRHVAPKNPIFLLEIFAKIYEKNHQARLLQLGQGEMTDQMKQKCCELGIEKAVIFAGVQKDVEKYYSAMDVFCFPSLFEGLGMAAVEAQTNGLHVVASESVPQLVDIGAGLYHRMDINEKMEQWVEELLRFEHYGRKTDADQYTKRTKYNLCQTVKEIEGLYTSMAEAGYG